MGVINAGPLGPAPAAGNGKQRKRAAYFVFIAISIFAQFAQRHGAVEDQAAGGRIRVHAEIAEPLELEPRARRGALQARLDAAAGQHLQRIRVNVRLPVRALRHVIRVRLGEERVVQARLRLERVRGRDPVQRGLDLAPVGRIAAARRRVVRAAHLRPPRRSSGP